ncbi:hypothetical protein [Morganella psychrotolerans]|uniref:ABM domain-containing protein n=1 Tax=Morganella psychrotolerans TaxID=368603 RepID=A0A1B8HEY0_9GAMM|nr:hypothetical protein [Morganella psychrotolerans]OBU07645.1 hypothetical protein AYY18_05300 [Morganella psychrotolerans]
MHLITTYIRIMHNHSFEDVYNYLKWLEMETKDENGGIFFSISPANREKGECIHGDKWKDKESVNAQFKIPDTNKLVDKGITEVVRINGIPLY